MYTIYSLYSILYAIIDVDRLPLVTSAILQIDQDVDEVSVQHTCHMRERVYHYFLSPTISLLIFLPHTYFASTPLTLTALAC